jgi:hypothetical protein
MGRGDIFIIYNNITITIIIPSKIGVIPPPPHSLCGSKALIVFVEPCACLYLGIQD